MSKLSILKEALVTGIAPEGAKPKKFQKLLKQFGNITDPQFVHLYPVRDCRYDDTSYRVFAMPVKGESINEETLEAIKEEIDALPLGCIRYAGGASGLRSVLFDTTTGKYLFEDKDIDDVMAVSDHFEGVLVFVTAVFSSSLDDLDAHYAVFGKGTGKGFMKWDGEYILPIPNHSIGKASTVSPDTFIENPDAPDVVAKAANKYMQIMQYVFYVLIAVGLVWYFLYKK